MSESGSRKSSALASLAKKSARSTHGLLQKLGKAERTVDDIYQDHTRRLARQEAVAAKLHKTTAVYLRAVHSMMNATRQLGESITEIYDEECSAHDPVADLVAGVDLMWADYHARIQEFLVNPVANYMKRIPEMKQKMAKYERKKVDFDRYRHSLATMKNKTKVNDEKVQQAEASYETAKASYDEIRAALHEELPQFYDDRMEFYGGVMTNLFTTLQTMHGGCHESSTQLLEHASGGEVLKHYGRHIITSSSAEMHSELSHTDHSAHDSSDAGFNDASTDDLHHSEPPAPQQPHNAQPHIEQHPQAGDDSDAVAETHPNTDTGAPHDQPSDLYFGRTVNYWVMSCHAYDGQEEDELTFQPGVRIAVVDNEPCDDDDDGVDEGWATGITPDGHTGVFPVNFTTPDQ